MFWANLLFIVGKRDQNLKVSGVDADNAYNSRRNIHLNSNKSDTKFVPQLLLQVNLSGAGGRLTAPMTLTHSNAHD